MAATLRILDGNAKGGNAIGVPNNDFQRWTTLNDWSNAS